MDVRTVSAVGDREWNWPCLHLRAEELVTMEVTWQTEAGDDIALPTDGTAAVIYLPAEGASYDSAVTVSDEAVVTADKLSVLDLDISALKGVYVAQLRLSDDSSSLRHSLPFIMSIEAGIASVTDAPVTLKDIRMTLFDRMASENVITGAQELADRTLLDGLQQAVRMWNDADPVNEGVSTQSFPNWLKLREGAAGYALRQYSMQLIRNRVQGQGLDGNQRADTYVGLAAEMVNGYLRWMMGRKQKLDADNGWDYA